MPTWPEQPNRRARPRTHAVARYRPSHVARRSRSAPVARGFTLVELMVVMAVIAVLVGIVITVGSSLVDGSRTKATAGMLRIVSDAVQQFHRDQPMLISIRQNGPDGARLAYKDRYGAYPPDELEVFTAVGLPGSVSPPVNRSLLPSRVSVLPSPEQTGGAYGTMKYRLVGRTSNDVATGHRDVAAMLLAIEQHSSTAWEIIQRIPSRYWSEGAADPASSLPTQFVDRDATMTWTPSAGDTQIRYLVDDWSLPIAYYAQRDYEPDAPPDKSLSSNHADWNRASTEMIRLARGQPILMSYGPDGRDQFHTEPTDGDEVLLHDDWVTDRKINNPFNADNVFSEPGLAETLREGAAP
jgi:prepilin-type N-terminal cleavage/methylation domain-containing protein